MVEYVFSVDRPLHSILSTPKEKRHWACSELCLITQDNKNEWSFTLSEELEVAVRGSSWPKQINMSSHRWLRLSPNFANGCLSLIAPASLLLLASTEH